MALALGGAAVLVSYVHGFVTHPGEREAIWGGVPESLRGLYTGNMLAAALGFFPLTYALLLAPRHSALPPSSGGLRRLIGVAYGAVLLPSALWLPLTYRMLAEPSTGLWWLLKIDLAAVGLGALALMAALEWLRPAPSARVLWAARIGGAAFVFQTLVLDAIVWTVYFPYP